MPAAGLSDAPITVGVPTGGLLSACLVFSVSDHCYHNTLGNTVYHILLPCIITLTGSYPMIGTYNNTKMTDTYYLFNKLTYVSQVKLVCIVTMNS